MKKVGLIGWRGMVGSCLMRRLEDEQNFGLFDAHLFSRSLKGETTSQWPSANPKIKDSDNLLELREMDILLSCQGSDYTHEILPKLRESGWNGYWLDASSALRMRDDAIIVLDPINAQSIHKGIESGVKNFSGGNCTVSLMLMALGGLLEQGQVEWISGHSYQAASGAGARAMLELMQQNSRLGQVFNNQNATDVLAWEKVLREDALKGESYPKDCFKASLALSVIPWIDSEMESGQSKEEWKAQAEANKILNADLKIDGTCVRVPSLRSHAQALTIKLKKDLPLKEIEKNLSTHNPWVKVIPNTKEDTLQHLSPLACAGSLDILVGRVRKLSIGPEYLNVFTLGDQLLWGAAEPLRRALILLLSL